MNQNKMDILETTNDETAKMLLPVMIYLGLLSILGTIGNLSVIAFYGCNARITANSCFVLTLAVLDFLTSSVTMPLEIIDVRFTYMFYDQVACKVLRFLSHFLSFGSMLLLFVICIDRYKRICKPLNIQTSTRKAIYICLVCVGVTAIFAAPSFVFYDSQNVNVTYNNTVIPGVDCNIRPDAEHGLYLALYSILQIILFGVLVTVLLVLYSLMVREMYRHRDFVSNSAKRGHFMNKKQTIRFKIKHFRSVLEINSEVVDLDIVASGEISLCSTSDNHSSISKTKPSGACSFIPDCQLVRESALAVSQNSIQILRAKSVDIHTRKFTLMMLLITAMSILSFIPYISIVLWLNIGGVRLTNQFGGAAFVALELGVRSYFLNPVINPFIYGFFNSRFKYFVSNLRTCRLCNKRRNSRVT